MKSVVGKRLLCQHHRYHSILLAGTGSIINTYQEHVPFINISSLLAAKLFVKEAKGTAWIWADSSRYSGHGERSTRNKSIKQAKGEINQAPLTSSLNSPQ